MILTDNKTKQVIRSSATVVGVVILNLLIGAVIILLIKANPWVAYQALISHSLGDQDGIANVLTRATPLIVSGLAVAVAFRAGIYNLGGEGQIYLGAFAAAWMGFTFAGLPHAVHLPMVLLISMAAGAVGAGIPGWLKVRYAVDEVISTLLLNSVYILFTGYLANTPFRDPTRWSGTTRAVYESAYLPTLWPQTGLSAGILVSILFVGLIAILFRYADIGYRWKMIGLNPKFARYGGAHVGADQLKAMLLSGALAGLAGGLLVTGSQYRFWDQIGGGVGWDGMLIALLSANNPIGVLASGLLFAVVKTGSLGMESVSSVPSELIDILLALLILLVTGRNLVKMILARYRRPKPGEE